MIARNFCNKNMRILKKEELKALATLHCLLDTGTKPVLINRIQQFLEHTTNATIIQKNVRAYFARTLVKSLIKTSKNRHRFVNDNDFYTLEPLQNVPFYFIFEFIDEENFSYGFNIESLINLYIKTGKVYNPYNRRKISIQVMFEIFTIYGLLRIMFKNEINQEITFNIPSNILFNTMSTNDVYLDSVTILDSELIEYPRHIDYENYESDGNIIQLLPIQQRTAINLAIMKDKLRNIQEITHIIRHQTINRRLTNVFMEIDQFGHYTDSLWLSSLNKNNLKRFVINLREIWFHRANLDEIDRYNIYPFGNPFENICNQDCGCILNYCVSIIENLVLCSPHINDRKLATLFILTALTRVSTHARRELNWLYESIDW